MTFTVEVNGGKTFTSTSLSMVVCGFNNALPITYLPSFTLYKNTTQSNGIATLNNADFSKLDVTTGSYCFMTKFEF